VLARESGNLLVISKYALDCQPYNTSKNKVTWETCTLRKWLNETFLNVAFSASERAMIPSVTVSADKNPISSTSLGNSTMDQVFLLSFAEANKYFCSDQGRACRGTTYCFAQGASNLKHYLSSGDCFWWLRSIGRYFPLVTCVTSFGELCELSCVLNHGVAVRPAMWIDFGF